MSKKMTDPDKWRDPWFRKLGPNEKLVFVFLIDQCNHGGFYEVDTEYMEFCIGIDGDVILGAIQGLNSRCFMVDGWVWIKNYLRHQKNEILNPDNNAHKHIIERVREQVARFHAVSEFKDFLGANKGLFSPPGKGKEKDSSSLGGFEEFWGEYPKKKSKGAAQKAWTGNGCAKIHAEIISAVKKQKRTQDWTKDGGQYIPYPATWLRARGWEDEIVVQQSQYTKDLAA